LFSTSHNKGSRVRDVVRKSKLLHI